MKIKTTYCEVDKLFYIRRNGELLHVQKSRPSQTDLIEVLKSDNWQARFDDMRSGKKVRVSNRIYWHMLGCVPPIKQTSNSFFCGEPYCGNRHYYFVRQDDGRIFGELRKI